MKNRHAEEFDFEVKEGRDPLKIKNKQIENNEDNNELLHFGDTSFDLSDNCLIVRKRDGHQKKKIYYYLSTINAAKVLKVRTNFYLVLAIIFLLAGIGGFIPSYFFISFYSFIILGAGLVLALLFWICYLCSKRVELIIRIAGTRRPKYFYTSNIKLYGAANSFIDELFYKRSKLPN